MRSEKNGSMSKDGCIHVVKTKKKSYSREFKLGVVGSIKNIIFIKRVEIFFKHKDDTALEKG